jgi:heme exporter protein D
MQQSIAPAMRAPLRLAIIGYLLLFITLALMRMRNLILLMEKRRPWVSELILKEVVDEPRIYSWSDFLAMGGYALRLAGGGVDRSSAGGAGHAQREHRVILRDIARQRAREARRRAARRRYEYSPQKPLWVALAVLAGLTLTTALVLYALRSSIDLFYTPGEILYGKRETQQRPERSASARRRDGRGQREAGCEFAAGEF